MPRKPAIAGTGLSQAHYAAIGLVAANFAALDALVASAIWQLGEIPDAIGACITAQIQTFDGRMNALISLLEVRGGMERTITKLNKFHEDMRGLVEFRNRVVHDGWLHDAKTDTPHRLQITAKKKPIFGYESAPTNLLVEKATKIDEKFDLFKKIMDPALERFSPLPLPEKST